MNLTCFYCQTPFTLSMDQKIAALRKMHAENLHHYDAHCPRCGRANAISLERLEMSTPGWEEAIKQPAMAAIPGAAGPAAAETPDTVVPSSPETQVMQAEQRVASPVMKKQVPKSSSRRRHAPAAKKAASKSTAKKATTKKTASKPAKKAVSKAKSKSASRKSAKKSKSR
jgi:hypothetical protein